MIIRIRVGSYGGVCTKLKCLQIEMPVGAALTSAAAQVCCNAMQVARQ